MTAFDDDQRDAEKHYNLSRSISVPWPMVAEPNVRLIQGIESLIEQSPDLIAKKQIAIVMRYLLEKYEK